MIKKKYFRLKFKQSIRTSFVLLFSLLFFLISASVVQTAGIYFDTQNETVGIDQVFELKVLADSEGEDINAIGGTIVIPNDYFEIQEIRDGNSLINFWVEKPTLTEDEKSSQVFFSGIIPGGYTGKQAYLFSVIIKARQKGKASITTEGEEILLNDGAGSSAKVNKDVITLLIGEEKTELDFSSLVDTVPPELFLPVVDRDPNLFKNNWFLVFATQDKNSGINYYEVYESNKKLDEKKLGTLSLDWIKTDSPYQLSDQSLKSYIYVRAWDKEGNVRVAEVAPSKIVWYKSYLNYAKIPLVLISVCVIILWWLKKRKKI